MRPEQGNSHPRIVAIGGGTGLSTMLRGLKLYTSAVTAVVTVADDGGGSGVLRNEMGMPPPGDVRNCIQALANTEPTMEALLAYRFKSGTLAGQSLGNLFLAALNDMSDSFDEAVTKMSDVLAITGRVLPVSNEDVQLAAEFYDGTEIIGESSIGHHKKTTESAIRRVRLIPESPPALGEVLKAIAEADMIVLGPGSLYTSVMPNLLTAGVSEAVRNSDALRVYVLNVMTQDGETEGFTASDHVRALFLHGGGKLFDLCLANSSPAPEEILQRYKGEGAAPTAVDAEALEQLGVSVLLAPIADWKSGLARHKPAALAEELLRIYNERSKTKVW